MSGRTSRWTCGSVRERSRSDIYHKSDFHLTEEVHQFRNGAGEMPDSVERILPCLSVRARGCSCLRQLFLQAPDLLEAAGHVAHHSGEAVHLSLLILERHNGELER